MTNYTTLQSLKLMSFFFFSVHTNFVKFPYGIMVSSDNDINIWHRPLLTPTIICVFPVFGSKVIQLNQICIFSSDYTEDFPGVFQTPLEYCFEKGLTEVCFRENCDKPAFIKCAHCEN
ncbi:hypothetical protein C0J52_27678 [Blattella germanica]|nr:hypothetical protein C0J52_27678 [Blattella germanica]